MNSEQEKELFILIKRLLWKQQLCEERIKVLSYGLRNVEPFKGFRMVSKAAISQALSLLDDLQPFDDIIYSSPIDKTGGLMIFNGSNNNSFLITERGTLLKTKEEIKKYMDVNKI